MYHYITLYKLTLKYADPANIIYIAAPSQYNIRLLYRANTTYAACLLPACLLPACLLPAAAANSDKTNVILV